MIFTNLSLLGPPPDQRGFHLSRSSSNTRLNVIESPCIGVCTLSDDDHCQGCLRTVDEILNWLAYTDQQRQEIMASLPSRRQKR